MDANRGPNEATPAPLTRRALLGGAAYVALNRLKRGPDRDRRTDVDADQVPEIDD